MGSWVRRGSRSGRLQEVNISVGLVGESGLTSIPGNRKKGEAGEHRACQGALGTAEGTWLPPSQRERKQIITRD